MRKYPLSFVQLLSFLLKRGHEKVRESRFFLPYETVTKSTVYIQNYGTRYKEENITSNRRFTSEEALIAELGIR